jgi:hypothetical protein
MLPYWLLYTVPAVAALLEVGRSARWQTFPILFMLMVTAIVVVVGLRFEVGGDWFSYLGYLNRAYSMDFDQVLLDSDPGYVLLNWLAARLNFDIWAVNLASAALFGLGLYHFCQGQPRRWLALAVAVPYLVIVVAMGYTRQGVAIGLAMMGISVLSRDGSIWRFAFWMLLAASFHRTAVLLIPLAALTGSRGRVWTILWIAGAAIAGYFVLLADSVDRLIEAYVGTAYDSGGAVIRAAMNVIPAMLFLLFHRRFGLAPQIRTLWTVISLVALAVIPALILSPSSTAVDRLSLYLIPLQIMVLSRLPKALAEEWRMDLLLTAGVVTYSGLALFVWLNFATYSTRWIPYQMFSP